MTGICTFYLQNACKRGDACTFSHISSPTSAAIPKVKVCSYFQRGKCVYGSKCLQLHERLPPVRENGKGIATSLPPSSPPPPPPPLARCVSTPGISETHIFSARSEPEVGGSRESSVISQVSKECESSSAPCAFHILGQCESGAACAFSHDILDDKGTDRAPAEQGSDTPEDAADTTLDHQVESQGDTAYAENDTSARTTTEDAGRHVYSALAVGADNEPTHYEPPTEMPSSTQPDSQGYSTPHHDDVPEFDPKSRLDSLAGGYPSGSKLLSPHRLEHSPNNIPSNARSPTPHHPQLLPRYPHVSQIVPHWSQFADPLALPSVAFCKRLAQGDQHDHEDCKFRHSLTPEEYTMLFRDEQPNLWTVYHGAISKDSVTHAPLAENSTPLCPFYLQGRCFFGYRCHNTHGTPVVSVLPDGGPVGELVTLDFTHDVSKLVPTPNIMDRNPVDVDNGWAMTNRRDEDAKTWPSSTPLNKSVKPCHFFRDGKCRKGTVCPYRHDSDKQSPEFTSMFNSAREQSEVVGDGSAWDVHESTPWDAVPQPGECALYVKGQCWTGDECTLGYHGNPTSRSQPDTATIRNSTWTEGPFNSEDSAGCVNQSYSVEQDNEIEASWLTPWKEESTREATPQRIDKPCKWFGQGYCAKGQNCLFSHISPPNIYSDSLSCPPDIVPSASVRGLPPSDEDIPCQDSSNLDNIEIPPGSPDVGSCSVVERSMFNCTVSFGNLWVPEHIITSAEGKIIKVFNLPSGVTPGDIEDLVRPFGEIEELISLDETEDSTDVQVEFRDSTSAAIASLHLHRQTYDSRELALRLMANTPVNLRTASETCTVKLSWPKATGSAWAYYSTIAKAKSEESRLNGLLYRSHAIKASFRRPDRNQTHSFVVALEGLPSDITKKLIEDLCDGVSMVAVREPLYSGSPVIEIREKLIECGELESFAVCPSEGKARYAAFATFDSEAAALNAVSKWKDIKLPFIGGHSLKLETVYFCRYQISSRLFQVLKSDLEKLGEDSKKFVKLEHYDHGESFDVYTSASLDKPAEFANLNIRVVLLLHGETLNVEDVTVWDTYFDMESSVKALDKLNEDASFFIQCDRLTRTIRFFGNATSRERAKNMVLRLLKKVRAMYHELPIDRTSLKRLLDGGFENLKSDVGNHKITLDVMEPKITLRGDSDDLRRVQDALDTISVTTEDSPDIEDIKICHICLCHCDCTSSDSVELSCKHVYCKTCLHYALQSVTGMGCIPLACVAQITKENGDISRCLTPIPFLIARDILQSSPLEEESLLSFCFLSFIRDNPNEFFFCPTLGCKAVYTFWESGFILTCSSCHTDVCGRCATRNHVGITCEEHDQTIRSLMLNTTSL